MFCFFPASALEAAKSDIAMLELLADIPTHTPQHITANMDRARGCRDRHVLIDTFAARRRIAALLYKDRRFYSWVETKLSRSRQQLVVTSLRGSGWDLQV